MAAPLIGIAAVAAAKLAAKKLAERTAKSATGRARSNSAAVAKAVAPKKLSPSAEKSIAQARKALGSTKPDPKALARKITQDKANEVTRIRKQGRNTR